jgi:hypothetical protein
MQGICGIGFILRIYRGGRNTSAPEGKRTTCHLGYSVLVLVSLARLPVLCLFPDYRQTIDKVSRLLLPRVSVFVLSNTLFSLILNFI